MLPSVSCLSSDRDEFSIQVLHAFVELHEFTDLNLVQALRWVLSAGPVGQEYSILCAIPSKPVDGGCCDCHKVFSREAMYMPVWDSIH